MRAPLKFALGFMSVWAVVYAFAALGGDSGVTDELGPVLGAALRVASILDVIAVFAAFTYLAMRSPGMRAVEKTGWVFAMLFFFPFVVPAFWYLHVWRTAPAKPPAGGPQ